MSRWSHGLCQGKWRGVCSFGGFYGCGMQRRLTGCRLFISRMETLRPRGVKIQTSDCPKSSPKPSPRPRGSGVAPVPPSCSSFQFRHSWDQERPGLSPSQPLSKQQRPSKNTVKLSKKKKTLNANHINNSKSSTVSSSVWSLQSHGLRVNRVWAELQRRIHHPGQVGGGQRGNQPGPEGGRLLKLATWTEPTG